MRRSGRAWFAAACLVAGCSAWAPQQQAEFDAQVERLCAQDGGITVYEKVVLPREQLDAGGRPRIPERIDVTPGDAYYRESENRLLLGSDEALSLRREEIRYVRRSDAKILGRSVRYVRRGGEVQSPAQTSFHACPARAEGPSFEGAIFVRSAGGR
jgi:hypothetical protein